jgi:hypothetical protein
MQLGSVAPRHGAKFGASRTNERAAERKQAGSAADRPAVSHAAIKAAPDSSKGDAGRLDSSSALACPIALI